MAKECILLENNTMRIYLYDLLGRKALARSFKINNNPYSVNLRRHPIHFIASGIYILEIKIESYAQYG